MKILIFSTAYLPFVGGAELAIKEITDRLSLRGFAFDLITLNLDRKQRREETLGRVRVIRLSCPKALFPFAAFMHANKMHRKEPYTHVWSVMASYGGFAGLFFKYHFPRVPFILTLQEGDSFAHIYRRALFVWPLFKTLFTRADHITAISNHLADWARRMGASSPVTVIPNGVEVEKFRNQNAKSKIEELRQKLGLKPEDKVVITTSRLVPKNGVGDLILAMRYLPENVKLIICGSGALQKSYKLKARSLQLESRVHFLGHIPHEQLPNYLHAADIFCRPSRSEGMGSSFIEAMAAGLPVVATPVGGIVDFIQSPFPPARGGNTRGEGEGEEKNLFSNSRELAHRWGEEITGLFCKVGDPKDIADRIKLLLSNDELRNRIIANGSKMVREKYGWDEVAGKMKTVFDTAAARV